MKKGQIAEGIVERVEFPNKGIAYTADGDRVIVKNTIPGQKVSFAVNKVRKGKAEGRLLQVVEPSALEVDSACPHFGACGGCIYQTLPYEEQLKLKSGQVKKLMDDAINGACEYEFLGIKPSPKQYEYRNKMEFSFGDEYKDGPLALGMHKRGSFYDIVTVTDCQIVDADFRAVLKATLKFFQEHGQKFYHRLSHEGYLRHLLVRKAAKTGEILIDLITTTQNPGSSVTEEELLQAWADVLCGLSLDGTIRGILHTRNDSVADVVKNEGTDILYGEDFFYEELLGLRFKISPFSFFQTNSLGAEVLYSTARDFIKEQNSLDGKTVFDLYSGTGTIAQMLAPVCKEVVGVEIVEEAVETAKENAALNGLSNCRFIAGDVLKVLDEVLEKPDYIVLDPPRDGIHPKAITKIIDYGVENMIYISCKPTSLARDLEIFLAHGYTVGKICCVDMFAATPHVETIVALHRTGM
ncbi:23S rRNA (uracil(1939)-C(5))-methyltransferase RlmD [Roseburia sp. MUC/MUC-530-WT-4D]|uniref:23S rRNA (Uracil(1939)-C(5))-methyltransferase RlmD n=1 Tax=Roseburia porci TaxID=2605790 RepID=A0A6L5YQ32_9FIRM|nr:23S rRNA (uracil(1939)-C(5))-methyltransferase RlmD [Roseburia porci]MST74683.1 23S rRNA (uracil(1939)-C(5))-methyltransferase RlmD [Roseburia porci]